MLLKNQEQFLGQLQNGKEVPLFYVDNTGVVHFCDLNTDMTYASLGAFFDPVKNGFVGGTYFQFINGQPVTHITNPCFDLQEDGSVHFLASNGQKRKFQTEAA